MSAAGIACVEVPGIENVDVSPIIKNHEDYPRRLREVLKLLKLEDSINVLTKEGV